MPAVRGGAPDGFRTARDHPADRLSGRKFPKLSAQRPGAVQLPEGTFGADPYDGVGTDGN